MKAQAKLLEEPLCCQKILDEILGSVDDLMKALDMAARAIRSDTSVQGSDELDLIRDSDSEISKENNVQLAALISDYWTELAP